MEDSDADYVSAWNGSTGGYLRYEYSLEIYLDLDKVKGVNNGKQFTKKDSGNALGR